MNGKALAARPIVIVERFWPGVTIDRLRASSLGTEVRGLASLGSIVVAADELVLSLYGGSTVVEVAAASRRSGLPFVRVVPATLLQPTLGGRPGTPAEGEDS